MKPFSLHKDEIWPNCLFTKVQSEVTCPCKRVRTESKSPFKWIAVISSRFTAPYFINLEFNLGLLILIISIICIFYYSSKINLFNKIETFQINSSFFDIGNVNIGNDVKIKGVKVGEVSGISLDQDNYMAIITSSIDESVKIPDNSTFKISNNGFIGSPYIEIQLGESEELLKNNDYTTDNIDAVSLEEIINNFIFK